MISLVLIISIIGKVCLVRAESEPTRRTSSLHAGLLHPAGVDVAGYTAGIAYTGLYPALSYEMRFR